MTNAPLISSQRYLDTDLVALKAHTFKVFIVSVMRVTLRGGAYRVVLDGHHNLAAARIAGIEPTWRGPSRKIQRIRASMSQQAFERMLINNLTDSDWYYVDSGEVVAELLGVERRAA